MHSRVFTQQRAFLKDFADRLVEKNKAYAKLSSLWAFALLLVQIPEPSEHKFTVDLRHIKKFFIRPKYQMIDVEEELSKLSGSNVYDTFELSQGYRQLLIAKEYQLLHSFITPERIFSSTCVLHETTNTIAFLQLSLGSMIPSSLQERILYRLDDILLHAATKSQLLESIKNRFLCFN